MSTRPHFTHGEAHTAKERKVHNSGGPYPCSNLRISRSLHQGRKPGSDMRFNVHNGEGPHPHPDVVSPAFLEALTSRNRTFLHPNWPKNDLRELLNLIYMTTQLVKNYMMHGLKWIDHLCGSSIYRNNSNN